MIFLAQPRKRWDRRCGPPCPAIFNSCENSEKFLKYWPRLDFSLKNGRYKNDGHYPAGWHHWLSQWSPVVFRMHLFPYLYLIQSHSPEYASVLCLLLTLLPLINEIISLFLNLSWSRLCSGQKEPRKMFLEGDFSTSKSKRFDPCYNFVVQTVLLT